MYNATLYLSSGFNATNVPDSPTTLALATSVTVPALDILQARELTSFTIKALYAAIKNADYLCLQNTDDVTDFAYYSIQNITMTSKDVAILSVTMDYVLSAGGVNALNFTDGITERHHVATADDLFGAYDEPDPFLTPSQMMKIETVHPDFKGNLPDANVTILASTVDLYEMYNEAEDQGTLEAIDYTSDATNLVTVPLVKSIPASFKAIAYMYYDDSHFYKTSLPGVSYYVSGYDNDLSGASYWTHNMNLTPISTAITYVRSLGVESCILAQYNVPYFMLDTPSLAAEQPARFITLKGADTKVALSGLPYIRNYVGLTIRNKRLFYGDNCQYNIVSIASGNSASFLPEEIYNNDNYPTIEMRVDPRSDGCPYFRFTSYRGDTTHGLFFMNAVKGLQWQNAPLIYQGASGSLLNQYKYNAQMAIATENKNYMLEALRIQDDQNAVNTMMDMAGGVISGVANIADGRIGTGVGNMLDAAGTFINGYYNAESIYNSKNHQIASYNASRNAEYQSMLIQNNVVAPSVNFPISEGIRDYVGNTCLVYRTYYTNTDAQRIDKILSMFGYRHTTPLTKALLTNRSKFNYIQASGVAVSNNNIPMWMRDGIAAQFGVGMRIWHTLPNVNAYTDGTNV